jgi:hypothetical protein
MAFTNLEKTDMFLFHGEARVPGESSFTARTINRTKKLIKIAKL